MRLCRPPPKLTVSEWADQFRKLSPEASAEPGQWITARAAYQRGIMDAVSDPGVTSVVMMTSAQVGKTEVLGNICGYHIHQDPAPIMVVLPTVEIGEAWSKDRLAPMLRDTPALRGKVSDARSRDGGNTLRHKQFTGGHLTISGANSAASLSSRPVRVVLMDEVDRYPASAGTEGDPVSLARKRANNFWNRRIILASTPTTTGVSRIEVAYGESDMRRFWVPCPHCQEAQVLRWENVRWIGEDHESALYHCEACGEGWTDAQRWAAIRSAEERGGGWRASRPFRGVAGFHLSELYSPWRMLSETAKDFIEAKGKPDRLRAFFNTALGETFEENGEAPDWQRLLERLDPGMMAEVVPAGALVLTAAVDNQAAPARLEMAVWAWAPGFESWLVAHHVFPGDPSSSAPWDEVAKVMAKEFPVEGGGTMRVARCGVDTGGQHTAGVYSQLRRLRDPRLMPLKGVPGWNKAAPVSGPTFVDFSVGGVKIKKGLRLWTVSVDVFKSDLYGRLWRERGDAASFPSGWVHLPTWMDSEQVQQLVAEQLVTVQTRRGFTRQEWRKMRANEQLDLAVYARAALANLGADRMGDRFWQALSRNPIRVSAPPVAPRAPQPGEVPAAVEVPAYRHPAPAEVPPFRHPSPYQGPAPGGRGRRFSRSSAMD